MKKNSFFIFFVILFSIVIVNADSNGVWNDASDIRGGLFGSDEPGFDAFFNFTRIYVGVLQDMDDPSYYINPSYVSNVKTMNTTTLNTDNLSVENIYFTNSGIQYVLNSTNLAEITSVVNNNYTQNIITNINNLQEVNFTNVNVVNSTTLNSEFANVTELYVTGGNVVSNCHEYNANSPLALACQANFTAQSMVFNQSNSNVWSLVCCKIN